MSLDQPPTADGVSGPRRARKYHIRPFIPSDIDQVKAIFQHAQEEYGESLEYCTYAMSHDLADVPAHYLQPLHSTFLCTIDGPPPAPSPSLPPSHSTVIGMVGLRPMCLADPAYYAECLDPPYPQRVPFDPRVTLEINRMAVSPSARRCGVAASLIASCVQFARAHGFHSIHLSTLATMPPALALYTACGFVRYRTDRQNWVNDPRIGTEEMRRAYKERGDPEEEQTRLFIDPADVPQDPAVHSDHRRRGVYYHTHLFLPIDRLSP